MDLNSINTNNLFDGFLNYRNNQDGGFIRGAVVAEVPCITTVPEINIDALQGNQIGGNVPSIDTNNLFENFLVDLQKGGACGCGKGAPIDYIDLGHNLSGDTQTLQMFKNFLANDFLQDGGNVSFITNITDKTQDLINTFLSNNDLQEGGAECFTEANADIADVPQLYENVAPVQEQTGGANNTVSIQSAIDLLESFKE